MIKRFLETTLFFVVFIAVILFATKALGQPASQPLNVGDPWSVFETLVTALQAHLWRVVVVAALVLLVLGLRYGSSLLATRLAGRAGAIFAWFTTDRGGACLVLASGIGGAALLAVVAGKAITLQLLVGGLTAGVTAAGGWTVVKRLIIPPDKTKG